MSVAAVVFGAFSFAMCICLATILFYTATDRTGRYGGRDDRTFFVVFGLVVSAIALANAYMLIQGVNNLYTADTP